MLVVAYAHGLHQPRVDAREVRPFGHGVGRDLEEVDHLPDPDPLPPARHVDDDDRSLVALPPWLLEEYVAIEHGEQGAADVHQPLDRLSDPGDAGGREARQDLTHDPCRGSANKRTDAKNDGV